MLPADLSPYCCSVEYIDVCTLRDSSADTANRDGSLSSHHLRTSSIARPTSITAVLVNGVPSSVVYAHERRSGANDQWWMTPPKKRRMRDERSFFTSDTEAVCRMGIVSPVPRVFNDNSSSPCRSMCLLTPLHFSWRDLSTHRVCRATSMSNEGERFT